MNSAESRRVRTRFGHPRFWPTWALLALLRLLALLPHRFRLRLGRLLGMAAHGLLGRRRRIARRNIACCFPDHSAKARRRLVRESFIATTQGYLEATTAWWGRIQPFAERMEVHGLEHLREAERRGRGVLLLGGHFSTLDFAIPLCSLLFDFNYMYRPHGNALFNAFIEHHRLNYSRRHFTKHELRDMMRHLREGHIVWYGGDQDFGPRNSVFAPFFGVPAATLTMPARIARRTGATTLFMSQFRESDEGVYSIRFSPILEGFGSGTLEEDATRMNAVLEEILREKPEQYLWMHRRFKTRPAGEERFY